MLELTSRNVTICYKCEVTLRHSLTPLRIYRSDPDWFGAFLIRFYGIGLVWCQVIAAMRLMHSYILIRHHPFLSKRIRVCPELFWSRFVYGLFTFCSPFNNPFTICSRFVPLYKNEKRTEAEPVFWRHNTAQSKSRASKGLFSGSLEVCNFKYCQDSSDCN